MAGGKGARSASEAASCSCRGTVGQGTPTARWLAETTGSRPSGVVDYVVDAEFIDGDLEIDLVSLAVVADDGRKLLDAVSNEFDLSRANDFFHHSAPAAGGAR